MMDFPKEITTMRIAGAALIILALGIYTVSTFIQDHGRAKEDSAQAGPEEKSRLFRAGGRPEPAPGALSGREYTPPHQPIPVASNLSPEVRDGFRGDVHPLLHGRTRLEVTAEWSPVGKGRDQLHAYLNKKIYSWFTELRPARPRQIYTERDFSAFLPSPGGHPQDVMGEVRQLGDLWTLDADKMAGILKQFHSRPKMHLVAPGRRAGPDGAFAILRAVSPAYLDIQFRIHAEFYLTPEDWPAGVRTIHAWYTPAYFSGHVLVNRRTGTVDHFRLGLATDKAFNVHLTVAARDLGELPRDIVRVERMELTGGDGGLVDKIPWTSALTPAEANGRLAKVFYKFMEIDWVPLEQVLAQARNRGRPIFAIVSWGATDDQSC